jgi:hypothetical protein
MDKEPWTVAMVLPICNALYVFSVSFQRWAPFLYSYLIRIYIHLHAVFLNK